MKNLLYVSGPTWASPLDTPADAATPSSSAYEYMIESIIYEIRKLMLLRGLR